jgi:hypothetical protein
LDKIVKQISAKVLRQTHLPTSLKDIKGHYSQSPHYKAIYEYLHSGKLPTNVKIAKKTIQAAQHHFLLDDLLFIIVSKDKAETTAKLCVPTSLIYTLLFWYHSSLLGSHMGITKTVETLNRKYSSPDLARHVRAYILGCHVCQMFKASKKGKSYTQHRITVDTPAMTKFSMDIKYMPPGINNYNFILVMYCEMSNFVVARPLRAIKTEEVCRNLIQNCFAYFGIPTHIICDQDSTFMASVTQFLYEQCDIKVKVVGTTNHKALKAEHGIKSVSHLLMKHLSGLGKQWPIYLPFAVLSHNAFHTPNLCGHSPFELVFGRQAKLIPELEIPTDISVSKPLQVYKQELQQQLIHMRKQLQKHRENKTNMENSKLEYYSYKAGQLVYLYNPAGSHLNTGSRKIKADFIGPLVIYRVIDEHQYILMSLDGHIYPYLVEQTRIKPGSVFTTKGNVETLSDLVEALKAPI